MKLKAEQYLYTENATRKEFTITFNVSKHGDFYIDAAEVPEVMKSLCEKAFERLHTSRKARRGDEKRGGTYFRADKLNDLEDAIKAAIEEYEESQVKNDEVKVLTYEFMLSGLKLPAVMGKDEDGDDVTIAEAVHFGGSDRWNKQDELEIKFQWQVLRQITRRSRVKRDEDKVMYLTMDDSRGDVGDDAKVIEYTPEREAFLRGVEEQLRNLMLRLEEFSNLQPEVVCEMIEKGSKLLLAGGLK